MELQREVEVYLERLAGTPGHADKMGPMRDCARGLLLSGERKSVEPTAVLMAPAAVSAKHLSLHHFASKAEWSDAALLQEVRALVIPNMGTIEAWIINDTGSPKKRRHSVGVARQYCGQLGKQDNCQVTVSLSVANEGASLPIAYQLYVPKEWADDETRRSKAELPQEFGFGDHEASNWHGFHHHASLCIAAYGFVVRSRLRRGKSKPVDPADLGCKTPRRPADFSPRGTPRAA